MKCLLLKYNRRVRVINVFESLSSSNSNKLNLNHLHGLLPTLTSFSGSGLMNLFEISLS